MKFPHTLIIAGASSGSSQDADGGYNPGGTQADPVYDGPVDAQEPGSKGLEFVSGDTKVQTQTADLLIFLKDESAIGNLAVDMQGTLTRGSRTDTVKIMKIRLLDGAIEVNTL